MTSYLDRDIAGLPPALWQQIDEQAVDAARDLLTARRFLEVDGPYGLGLTSLEIGSEHLALDAAEGRAATIAGRAVGVPMLKQSFDLSIRRVEGHLSMDLPLDLQPVEHAAEAIARREEELIYLGLEAIGLSGLMNADGRHVLKCSDWEDVEDALNDVIKAIDLLDGSGFRGPYALALSPHRYNSLFRRYEGSDLLQFDHLGRLCELGLFKAPVEGAVVVDRRVGEIKVGQDMQIGYAANDGVHFKLFASESLALLIDDPAAICTLG